MGSQFLDQGQGWKLSPWNSLYVCFQMRYNEAGTCSKCCMFCCLITQLCLTLCDPMDCSPPGCSVDGISQARYWSGLSFPSPGDLPNPGIKPTSPALAGGIFTTESQEEPSDTC